MVCVHLMTERPLGADIFLPAFSHRRQRSFSRQPQVCHTPNLRLETVASDRDSILGRRVGTIVDGPSTSLQPGILRFLLLYVKVSTHCAKSYSAESDLSVMHAMPRYTSNVSR